MSEQPLAMGGEDQCDLALRSVHAFLHGELPEASADEIRRHLIACEKCMDDFDAEDLIGALLRRCCGPASAPATLRIRVSRLSVHYNLGPGNVAG